MSDIKAVFFDFDGVLGTHARGTKLTATTIAELNDLDVSVVIEAFTFFLPKLRAGKITEQEFWPEFCAMVGTDIDFKDLAKAFKAAHLNKDMMDLAKKIKKSGFEVGIITDNSVARTESITKQFKLDATFSPIICGAAIGVSKGGPHAGIDPYTKALKAVGAKAEETIFIDDDESNLEIPEDIGLHVYHHDFELNDISALRIYLSGFGILV